MPLAEILWDLNQKRKRKAAEDDQRRRLIKLKQKKTRLEATETILVDEINSGQVNFESEKEVADGNSEISDDQVKRVFSRMKTKQKLEGLAYMSGITCWREEQQVMHYTFDPFIRGYPKGPYSLRMVPSKGRLALLRHTIPEGVPLTMLYEEYFENTKDPTKDSAKILPDFLKTVFRYLRAYLSRVDQVKELNEFDLGDNVSDVQHTEHYTSMKLVLSVQEKESDHGGLQATISVSYEEDGERPIPGSLKVDTNMDVDVQALEEQCYVFYTRRLKDAIIEAF